MPDQTLVIPPHQLITISDSREAGSPNRYTIFQRKRGESDWKVFAVDVPGGGGRSFSILPVPDTYELGFKATYFAGWRGWRDMWGSSIAQQSYELWSINYDDTGGDKDYNDLIIYVNMKDFPTFPILMQGRKDKISNGETALLYFAKIDNYEVDQLFYAGDRLAAGPFMSAGSAVVWCNEFAAGAEVFSRWSDDEGVGQLPCLIHSSGEWHRHQPKS